MVSKPKRIVFYRIGAIGDIIHTLPLLQLTKELNQNARIEYIIGSKQVAELLEQYTDFIDKVHVIKHKEVFDKPLKLFINKEEKQLINKIQETPIDEFIFLHGNQVKAQLINQRLLKAKKLFVYKRNSKFSAVTNYVITRFPELEDELLEDSFKVIKSHTLKAKKALDNLSSEKSISIVLGVGALRPTRAYPVLKWIKLIEFILSTTNYTINILGGPDEKDLSLQFEKLIKQREANLHYNWLQAKPDFSRVKNLIAKTSLLDLAQVLKNTDRLFSADTGILHIAAALNVPVSSVFSITSEKRFGPFSENAKVYQANNCSCQKSASNFPKHCHDTVMGYAKCMYELDFCDMLDNAKI